MFLQATNVSEERKHFKSWHDTVQHCANTNTDAGEYIGAFVIDEREKKTRGGGRRAEDRGNREKNGTDNAAKRKTDKSTG